MTARTYPKMAMLALLLVAPLFFSFTPQRADAAGCPSGTTEQDGGITYGYRTVCVNGDGEVVGSIIRGGIGAGEFTPNSGFEQNGEKKKIAQCQSGGILDPVGEVGCALAAFAITIFAAIISFFTFLMDFAEAAFNIAIQYTVVDFATWFDYIRTPVTQAWTTFRDLGNILIIGFFVFIAISIILGLQEYGQKKLIARVVIVAILINFSFLFTTLVINASNLAASSIYEQFPSTQSADGSQSVRGIGSDFAKYLGIRTIRNTGNTLMNQYNSPNGFAGVFWYGFLLTVFSLAATAVFVFGAFLLFSRFIALVLLVILSALAFATYLSPAFAENGWSRWWHSLLNNAFLAPILMLFLIVAHSIAKQLAGQGVFGAESNLALGNIFTNPADPGTWKLVMSFVVILGILAGGMYIASQMASGFAKRLAGYVPVALGAGVARYGVAPIARRYIGGRAAMKAENLKRDQEDIAGRLALMTKDDPRRAGLEQKWMSLARQKGRQDRLAKSSFDLMNTKPLAKLGAAAGLPGALTGASKANYADDAHKQVKAAVEEATKAAISSQDATKIARKDKGEDETGRTTIERERDAADTNLRAAQKTADAAKALENLPEKMAQAQRDLRVVHDEVSQEKVRIAENPALTAREKQIQRTALDKRIQEAQEKVNFIQSRVDYHDDANTREFKKRLDAAKDAVKQEQKEIEDAARTFQRQSSLSAQNIAAKNVGSWYGRMLRRNGFDPDPHVSHEAREETAARTKGARMDRAKQNKQDKEDTAADHGHGGGAAHAPAGGGDHGGGGAHH